jgi:hypothetical protein
MPVLLCLVGCGQGLYSLEHDRTGDSAVATPATPDAGMSARADTTSRTDSAMPPFDGPPTTVLPDGDDDAGASTDAQTRLFPPATGGYVDYAGARLTVNSTTFDGQVTVTIGLATPPRLGPAGNVYEVAINPRVRTRTPARILLRAPADWAGSLDEWQLAYFKPKPDSPPGLWITCQNATVLAAEKSIEGEAPGFDTGIEYFAFLRRCTGPGTCGALLSCVSMLCQ